MTEFSQFHRNALAESMEILGETVSYRGVSYKAVVNSIEFGGTLQFGGEVPLIDTVIILQKCDLNAVPVVGDTVVTEAKTVRIETVDSDASSYELKCTSSHRAD